MKHKILIAIAMVFFASCMKVKKKGDEEATTSNNESATAQTTEEVEAVGNRNKELSYKYLDLDKGNLAHVQFSAPSNWPKEIVVRKVEITYTEASVTLPWQKMKVVQTKESAVSESVVVPNASGAWDDFLVSENKVNFKFYSKVDKDLILLDEVEVIPPQDLNVSEDLNLRDKFQLTSKTKTIFIKQLQIAENAHLYLENYSGEVIIQNLNSKSGFIQSYPQVARADGAMNGLSGGVVKISISEGTGILNIFMRGQDGRDAAPAKTPGLEKKGAKGLAAKPPTSGGAINFRGGIDILCGSDSAGAGNGGQGAQGYPGNDGGNGGDSGFVTVRNLSPTLEVNLFSKEGRKGVGTDGGEGGDGGDGGDGLAESSCGPAVIGGLPGPKGGPGQRGHDGYDGQVQKSCVITADQSKKCINE